MTQDEIIEMAREAEIKRRTDVFYSLFCDGVYFDELVAFAKLVAAKEQKKWEDQTAVEIHEAVLDEREACAKIVQVHLDENSDLTVKGSLASVLDYIKARGEA